MSQESSNGGAGGAAAPPPQYIITTPSEVDPDEELGSPEKHVLQSQQFSSTSSSTKVATRSYSMSSSTSALQQRQETQSQLQQIQQQQMQQQQTQQMQQTQHTQQKIISSSTRSQSLQSSTIVGEATTISTGATQMLTSAAAASLAQQLKAQSSTSIITSSEQRTSTSTSCSSSTRFIASGGVGSGSGGGGGGGGGGGVGVGNSNSGSNSSGGKTRFQSFLQQPEGAHHGFLTAHQKHVRQFVRSTSAHSEAAAGVGGTGSGRPEKCIRSASTQIDDPSSGSVGGVDSLVDSSASGGSMQLSMSKLGLQQSSSILISKSAETIEMKSSSSSAGMRTQLTLSGGFLAPPGNRKITILSPIHAPPGLHDMLKRAQGRSPLSPRISFPGSDSDLFG
ncbi:cAMP-specific 3',5'-cyclic phosphodiesterase-like isoform X6 [Drosophila gunungcola]|uniref:Uncharacterized protein n=1 Tax=Drosophila gunungcola TaxID=103775 RepID=A0A9Q0BI29_9MUSC|nr:cAMP-specific 3',5'-cyclic phosphodiesterase-like isoform X5 [Drosophila gunungcola]XP_052858238.1 cAMP-specific 3',5'-cyclic phosphodiesterase-like isoform X6 [Drosophila gunungcola]KAI8033067.1 hypothetical protein M5D96_014176 [Drosophila gunungcola]